MNAKKDRQPPIWLVSTLLTAASVYMAWTYLRGQDQLADAITVPIPLLVIGFMAAEYFVVHLHFRSESITISFIAMPLILGALYAQPFQVWAAMTFGAACAFMLIRKQAPVKASFNTANLSLQAAIALAIIHRLGSGVDALGPAGWFAAAAAAVVSTIATSITLALVVSIVERRVDWGGIRRALLITTLTAFTSASVALIAATLIDARPSSLLLLLAPVTVLFIAYRSVVSEREHRERVQHMHESASQIRAIRHHSAIPNMLDSTAGRLRAARADLILLPVRDSAQTPTWFSAVNGTTHTQSLDAAQLELAPQLASAATVTQFVSSHDRDSLQSLLGTPIKSALMGVVHGEGGVLGVLSVSNRLGDVTLFTDDDLAMFATVVDQLTLALDNNELGQAVTELKRVEQELSAQAHHDALTGLANRNLLFTVLDQALAAPVSVSVLYIDLDDFKLINDGLGHEAGDTVLVETSNRLRAAVGADDCVARLGGDEFAVVLVDARHDLLTANRLLDIVNQPITIAGHEVHVGASIGLTRARPGQDPASLLASADAAMYTAKGAGKGAVILDKPATPTRIRSTIQPA